MLSTKETKLVGSFMEVRYPINMSVLNVYGDFQKEYQGRYPELKYDEGKLSLTTVREIGEPSSIYTSPTNTGYIFNGIEDKAALVDRATQLVMFSSEKYGIDMYDWLGIRFNYILPSSSLNEDTKEFFEKLLSKNAVKQVGHKISGFELTIVAETSDFQYRLILSFVKRAIADDSLPEHGLLADIDCFKESISVADALKFIEAVQRTSVQKVTDILNNFLVRRDR